VGTSNNIELCSVISQKTLQSLKEQVAKAKKKELGKRKMDQQVKSLI
jgi:hypothetical protein